MTDPIEMRCPAKLNLLLRVLAREESGYHSLETIFCRIDLADELVVEKTESGIGLEVDGPDLGPKEANLAWRAADSILAATGRRFGVRMLLKKVIPAGAGLGGGSSDAAAALLATNRLTGDAVPRSELFNIAYRLGADVPFFLSEAPLALGWGHGQRLLRLPPLPTRPALLLLTGVHVDTSEAYRWVDQTRASDGPRGSTVLDPDVINNWSDLARLGGNDFESAVFAHHPEVRSAFEALAGSHPLLCRMSGSGSALFAVYRSERDREDAAAMLGERHGTLLKVSNG